MILSRHDSVNSPIPAHDSVVFLMLELHRERVWQAVSPLRSAAALQIFLASRPYPGHLRRLLRVRHLTQTKTQKQSTYYMKINSQSPAQRSLRAGVQKATLSVLLLASIGLASSLRGEDYVGLYSGKVHTYCPVFNYTDPVAVDVGAGGIVSVSWSPQGVFSAGHINANGVVSNLSITVQSLSRGTVIIPYTARISNHVFTAQGASGDITSVLIATNMAPMVSITSPTSGSNYSTALSSVNLFGTASDNIGVTQVTWSNDQGGSGTASGTTSWTANAIALQRGANILTVTAYDADYNTGQAALTVIYNPPTLTGIPQNNNFVLKWPTNAVGFKLEFATNLPATSWVSNATPPAIVSGQYTVTNAISGGKRFYRLKH